MKMETYRIRMNGTQQEQSLEGVHGRGVSLLAKSVSPPQEAVRWKADHKTHLISTSQFDL